MSEYSISTIISEWQDEFNTALAGSYSVGIALFTTDGELLFANSFMRNFFKGEARENFLNPEFDTLVALENSASFIFEGYLTLGDYASVNTSLWAQIFRKENKLLVLGGVDAEQCIERNKKLHELNHEILELQREVTRKNQKLENTIEQLNTANAELEELNATKDKFFSIIGHDLKNPFHSLLGFSDILLTNADKYTPEKIRHFAKQMHESSSNAYNLLENLLEWAKIQKGELESNPEKVDPLEIVDEVKEVYDPLANSKSIDFHTAVNSNDYVFADKEMLKTVLRNLVANALKFTYHQGYVIITTESIKNYVRFTVSDTGMGIPPGYIDNLFSIDCKLSEEGTDNEKSTGLGLILCKEFVEKQGGKIWVESELEKGSDFKFTIPVWED